MRSERVLAPLFAAALLLAGCGKKEQASGTEAATETSAAAPAPTGEAPRLELGTKVQLDSGNAAFRAKDYKGALAHYRAATERDPQLAAAWFGLYMAQSALGDKAGADSSMQKVQAISPGTMGAHPGNGTGEGALPPGHPGMTPGALPPGHPTTSAK